jgi:hypothetical protein
MSSAWASPGHDLFVALGSTACIGASASAVPKLKAERRNDDRAQLPPALRLTGWLAAVLVL